MKKTDNKEMLNAIREQASADYKEKVPMVDGLEVQPRTVLDKLQDYPIIKNEFINTLINKVVKTDFFSRVYSNPLKELKKGTLAYGSTIEELFVMAADAKGFFTGSTFDDKEHGSLTMPVDHGELLGAEKANIKKLYVTLNFAHVFKTSISDSQLAHAFTSANGLSELVNQITSSLVNGAEQREYKDMINLLNAAAQQKQLKTDGKGLIEKPNPSNANGAIPRPQKPDGGEIAKTDDLTQGINAKKKCIGVLQSIYKVNAEEFGGTTHEMEDVSIAIRSLTGRMKFVSDKYNMAGVPTFCTPEDLVFVTTPEIVAKLDVSVLANAFNVSMADIKTKIILVDELPTHWYTGRKMTTHDMKDGVGYYNDALSTDQGLIKELASGEICYGLLMDKNFIQAIDTVNEARQFENGRALMTNLFLHRQGMLANCYFANCVAIFNGKGYTKVKPSDS